MGQVAYSGDYGIGGTCRSGHRCGSRKQEINALFARVADFASPGRIGIKQRASHRSHSAALGGVLTRKTLRGTTRRLRKGPLSTASPPVVIPPFTATQVEDDACGITTKTVDPQCPTYSSEDPRAMRPKRAGLSRFGPAARRGAHPHGHQNVEDRWRSKILSKATPASCCGDVVVHRDFQCSKTRCFGRFAQNPYQSLSPHKGSVSVIGILRQSSNSH